MRAIKWLKLMVLAVATAMFMLVALAGPASAADPRGRGASVGGLTEAAVNVSTGGGGSEVPTESISLNIVKSQDPTQPGTTPGGGGLEP
jgi:hypothetical protein